MLVRLVIYKMIIVLIIIILHHISGLSLFIIQQHNFLKMKDILGILFMKIGLLMGRI